MWCRFLATNLRRCLVHSRRFAGVVRKKTTAERLEIYPGWKLLSTPSMPGMVFPHIGIFTREFELVSVNFIAFWVGNFFLEHLYSIQPSLIRCHIEYLKLRLDMSQRSVQILVRKRILQNGLAMVCWSSCLFRSAQPSVSLCAIL